MQEAKCKNCGDYLDRKPLYNGWEHSICFGTKETFPDNFCGCLHGGEMCKCMKPEPVEE